LFLVSTAWTEQLWPMMTTTLHWWWMLLQSVHLQRLTPMRFS